MAPGGQEPSTMTASDLHQVFAPSVDEAPSLEHEVRTPDLTRPRVIGLQPELQRQETGDAGTGALLESIAAILENPEFLAMQTEGPIPHAFEAGRQLDIQRNEPERLLRQLLDRYGARLQGSKSIPDTRTQGINLIREGGPALEARDQSRVGRPQFTPSRAGVR